MSFFSKVKSAAKRVGKTAVRTSARTIAAPTNIANRVAGKVLPRNLARAVRAATNLSPSQLVARKALSLTSSRPRAAAPQRVTPTRVARAAGGYASVVGRAPVRARPMRAQVKPGGIFGRVANAFTSPTASPSASAPAPARGGGPPGDDGGGPAYGGGGYDDSPGQNDDDADDGSQANSPDTGYYAAEDSDPTEDLPDDFLDRDEPEEGDMGYLGEIDYHAALADLGDWKSDLANFGKTAAKDVARDALTQAGKSLTKGATPPPPPKVEPMGTGVKVAIGGGLALVGLVLVSKMMGGRSSSSERVAA